MRIQYLGTAAAEGWPALFCSCPLCQTARKEGILRTRTQSLIDGDLLIDFPPDSYVHALINGINLGEISTLLVTHSHMDHWFPTDFVHRHELFAHDTKNVLHIYGNEAVHQSFLQALSIDRFKSHPVDDVIEFHVVHGGDRFRAGKWEIIAVPADHDKREECLVYILKKDGKTLFYGHDTGLNLSDEAWTLLEQEHFDLISLDATMGAGSMGGYHMGVEEAEQFAGKLEKLGAADKKTVKMINHFSHNGKMTNDQMCAWGKAHGFLVTMDGMEVEF